MKYIYIVFWVLIHSGGDEALEFVIIYKKTIQHQLSRLGIVITVWGNEQEYRKGKYRCVFNVILCV